MLTVSISCRRRWPASPRGLLGRDGGDPVDRLRERRCRPPCDLVVALRDHPLHSRGRSRRSAWRSARRGRWSKRIFGGGELDLDLASASSSRRRARARSCAARSRPACPRRPRERHLGQRQAVAVGGHRAQPACPRSRSHGDRGRSDSSGSPRSRWRSGSCRSAGSGRPADSWKRWPRSLGAEHREVAGGQHRRLKRERRPLTLTAARARRPWSSSTSAPSGSLRTIS